MSLTMIRPAQFARTLARALHEDEGQTYDGRPYVYHLDAVAVVSREMLEHVNLKVEPYDQLTLDICAYLHDTVEDTNLTVEVIKSLFGHRVAYVVEQVTDPTGYSNRKTRKAALYERLTGLSPMDLWERDALFIKIADRIANIANCAETGNSMLNMYAKEQDVFFDACYHEHMGIDWAWERMQDLLNPKAQNAFSYPRS